MPPPRRRAIVTRPARDAAQWVADLQARGVPAVALPLIAIGPATQPALQTALQQARADLCRWRALMFVSGNAVHYFFEPNQALALDTQALTAIKTRAWAPGPGTRQALLEAGVPAAAIDSPAADAEQFDSESLWLQVQPQVRPGDRVLVVRGTTSGASVEPGGTGGRGRDWLAQQIEQAGGQVDFVAVYERGAPQLTPAQQSLAQQATVDGSVWLLSSSEAVAHLAAALPGQHWQAAQALCTHPRIAQAARGLGFGMVTECRPALSDVVASIESLR
ncbi:MULTISPECIES: uroporphyrinogen-III synthase [unclassified Acidovorax]|uniref:uroporphyrinogen-III synthase n=1 Tax=unclassified Acidovorax TaxID=2684926 RepID=UPI003857E03D